MARILRSLQATNDLLAIWEYIAQDDPVAASGMLSKIDKAVHLLADNPLFGEEQPQIKRGLRRFVVGSYLIFYEPIDDGIQVVRIFHGARRYEDML